MRTLLSAALGIVALGATSAMARGIYHNGYIYQNRGYVAPHYQSAPDHSYNNNWSASPNVNPYTGQQGTRQPTYDDRPPAYNHFPSYPGFGLPTPAYQFR
jgi:hypothetical protein